MSILTEEKTETNPVLSARELPPTFTLRIACGSTYRYTGTISNYRLFNAVLCYTDMDRTDEIPHTLDQCTYDFILWPDSYILIEYQGNRYILDAQVAEEEVH